MKHWLLIVLGGGILLLAQTANAQTTGFSDNPDAFMSELEQLCKDSGRKELQDLFKSFEKRVKQGGISPDRLIQLRDQAILMREQGMTPSPYFESWLRVIESVAIAGISEARFGDWLQIYAEELASIEKRKFKPVKDFLDFSEAFFSQNALRYSPSGISWYADPRKGTFARDTAGMVLIFETVDVLAQRKQDSIQIMQTRGRYYPARTLWLGEGGHVDWSRTGNKEIQCFLSDYTIDLTQSLYTAENTELLYPLFFGEKRIKGRLTDKVVVRNLAVEGSYPKFESYEQVIEIADIGGGVRYQGGFRLEGSSIYGFGNEDVKARISQYGPDRKLRFQALSEQFTLKREELVTGARVETTLYLAQDSIYHPSLDFRFEINKGILRLTRGARASDKSPFYSSMHRFDFDVDGLTWYMNQDTIKLGERSIAGTKGRDEMQVVSEDFYSENDYRRIQSIADANPIEIIKQKVDALNQRVFSAGTIAFWIHPDFTVENIQTLLFDLVRRGFVFYDYDKDIVEIKPKLDHYVESARDKRDHDYLHIISTTRQDNAVYSLKDSLLMLNGVPYVEFSRPQKVAVRPANDQVLVKRNRDLDFAGRLFAGNTLIQGKDMHFRYPDFTVGMDSIQTFDLYLPTGRLDSLGNPIVASIGSRIENFAGVLQIDAPENKAGKRDIPLFPALQATTRSYVYYDYPFVQGGVYLRDSFYFEVDPFTFNSLDNYTGNTLQFKGRLVSDSIFPDIAETLRLMPDTSLGFVTQSPSTGWGTYVDRGRYSGELSLSNRGLEGKGLIQYLKASAYSEDVVFRPKQMVGSARQFDITEDRVGPIFMPKVTGNNVAINWLPYQDSMYVTSQDKAFDFYEGATHTLSGLLILTPDGLRGRGVFDWDKGYMESQLLAFGAHDVQADTLDLKIRALGSSDLAFDTRNVNGNANFDDQFGKFRANSEELSTVMPYNRYQTSMNEFEWDMAKETITFKSDPGKMAEFLCTDPVQDSLRYEGNSAFYNLKTNLLQIGGVPRVFTADAWVFPADGKVEVKAGGIISPLENARIIADTTHQYHVINRATVEIKGRRHYEAKGYYAYNVGSHQQEILFEKIVGYPVGKGAASEKIPVTRAEGQVVEDDNFFIDHKTRFEGTIAMEADSPELSFDGHAYLDADRLTRKDWFSLKSKADKNNLLLRYQDARSRDGEPVRTGFFINKSSSHLYPSIMTPTFLRKDRGILEAEGMFRYDRPSDTYYFGDSVKVAGTGRRGNLMVFSNATGRVYGEGKLTFGTGLDLAKIDGAGTLSGTFQVPDSLYYEEGKAPVMEIEAMLGLEFLIPEDLLKVMLQDITKTYDGAFIDYVNDPFYERYLSEFLTEDDRYTEVVNIMKNRALTLPESFEKYPFFLPKVGLKWSSDLQSFLSTGDRIGVASVGNEMLNRYLKGHLEIRMPSNEDDRLYLLLRSGSEFYYFFGYRGGILSITSNNPAFMDAGAKLKSRELVIKMPDDKVYEIQFVGTETADLWLRRIQEAGR
ncbi:MAG: hypothetical protein J5I41_01445 [Saprospiraceae bacterium]|nr:hypothetical protein [Saprospiraceae bacterium]